MRSHKLRLRPIQPPSPQRQTLKRQDLFPDIHDKSQDTNDDAQYIHHIIPVVQYLARAAAVNAPLLLGLDGAREGFRHQRALEQRRVQFLDVAGRRGPTRGLRERIYESEDEVSGESTAEIGNPGAGLVLQCMIGDRRVDE